MIKPCVLLLAALLATGNAAAAERIFVEAPTNKNRDYGAFHIGATGIQATIQKGLVVSVDSVQPATPAAGKLNKGDVLIAVNGRPLAAPDAWTVLGEALGVAEGSDGRMVFSIQRDQQPQDIVVPIPVLGAYSSTWPLECPKSAAIITQTAASIARRRGKLGTGLNDSMSGLFLLSTGDDAYLSVVKEIVMKHSADKVGDHSWTNGYSGVLLGEYYLRTGDEAALPRLQAICDDSARRQYYGGWSHGGSGTNGGYVCGGLMNPAGAQLLTTLLLAEECGLNVNPKILDNALRFFYRFAGHAAVPYGDHRPELWLSCNGKNGMIACALSLVDNDACRQASRHYALDMADSYRWLLTGHSGGGFDVVWRGLAAHLVAPEDADHYRRSMDMIRWHYDLSRLPGGGFAMVGGGSHYSSESFGSGGMGLAYTAPLKTLRITGAAPGQYSHRVRRDKAPWGNERDQVFLLNTYCDGFGQETLRPDQVYEQLQFQASGSKEPGTDNKELCIQMLRHYNYFARHQAAIALARQGAVDELAHALNHADPRVRRAACDGIDNYAGWSRPETGAFTPDVVTAKFLPGIDRIINDPDASWWELDGAFMALSRAEPKSIVAYAAILQKYLEHEEWFLRESAGLCIASLAADPVLYQQHDSMLMGYLQKERHLFPRRAILTLLRKYQTNKTIDADVKKAITYGLADTMQRMEIESGHLAGMTLNNRYEMMRFFYAQAPELSDRVVAEADMMLAWPGPWPGCPIQWYYTGEGWGNPGILASLAKLPPEQRPALLAKAKEFLQKLKARQAEIKGNRESTKSIDGAVSGLEEKIAAYEKQSP